MLIGYFRNIPPIEKLGRIDGYGRFETFLKVFIPVSKNGILVAAVISFIFSWNEFTYASILVNGTKAVTFQHQLVHSCFSIHILNIYQLHYFWE